jgi:hypothetical protein
VPTPALAPEKVPEISRIFPEPTPAQSMPGNCPLNIYRILPDFTDGLV